MVRVLKTELECVSRECDRNCGKCDLSLDREEIVSVYKTLLSIFDSEPHIEINLYDIEETYENCTVQILRNSITGETSVGWWEN